MAMVHCRECKKQVSASAPTCPHCGIQDPGKGAQPVPTAKDGLIGLAFLGVVVAVVMFACSDSDEEKKAAADARAKADAACMTDLQCIGDKGTITAGVYCQSHIESLAKGAVKWTDGALEPKFSRFRWRDKAAGIVSHIGDKAQFQNGFGAFVNVIYTCDLDMRQTPATVVHVDVAEGRLR